MTTLAEYHRLRRAVAGEPLPLALVDLDAFDANLDAMLAAARGHGKRLRLATKSVRSLALLRRAAERAGDTLAGLMAFTVPEAAFLVDHGFTDLFVAYPTARAEDAAALFALNERPGVQVGIVADCEEHLDRLERAGVRPASGARIPIVVDVDLSLRLAFGGVYVGVRRSPLRDPAAVEALVAAIGRRPGFSFLGLMAYEAQVAGLTDRNPFTRLLNPVKAAIRRRSVGLAAARREALVARLAAAGARPALVNGGGTGSLSFTALESAVTEVAFGSGLLAGHLFDYYSNLLLSPAAYFAVQVVRRPGAGFVTCLGGGYPASGEAGADRSPLPVLPPGLALTRFEGAGEVQTPLAIPPASRAELALGDPVFFRHAKSGELCERFAELLLVQGERVVERVPTYRGEGKCFL